MLRKDNAGSQNGADLFVMLFEQASDGILIAEPGGNFVDVNPAACDMLGYTRQELLQLSPVDLITPHDREEKPPAFHLLEVGRPLIIERNLLRKDGSTIAVELNAQRLSDGRYLATVRDLTERRHHEQKVREVEDRLLRTLDHLLEGCQIIAYDWTYLYVNDAVAKQARKTKRELLGHKMFDVFPGFEKTSVFGTLQQCMKERKSERLVNRFEHLDGSAGWFELSIQPVPEGLFILSADITERRQSEEAINRMNAELEAIVQARTADLSDLYNNAPCGYHSIDENGVFIRMNDTELRWLGYTREEIIGKVRVDQVISESSRAIFEYHFPRFRETGFISDIEMDFVKKNGTILPVLLSSTAVFDESGRFIMSRSTIMNHSESRRIAKQLRDSNEELEAFAYSVSHDLRAPLRAIDAWTSMLEEELGDDVEEEVRHLMQRIHSQIGRMSDLITALFQLSRLSRMDVALQTINVSSLARTIMERLLEDAPQRAGEIDWELEDGLSCEADPQLLDIALTNLIENAIKYTSHREKASIHFCGFQEHGRQWFRLVDNGAGFDPRYSQNLFRPFQRLHPATDFPGNGIGLATVRRIVHRHGGEIRARALPDRGARFEFTLTPGE